MKKRKAVNYIGLIILIAVIAGIAVGLILNRTGYNIGDNIQISISDNIVKTDLENQEAYKSAYNKYELKDDYEYYTCIMKVDNKSNKNIAEIKFRNVDKDNFRIDYDCEMFPPLWIEGNSVAYVPCIISVKKGISDEELKKIPYQLPSKIKVYFVKNSDDLNYSLMKYMNYTVSTDDYSGNKLTLHTAPV